jgi:ankyrin repeat protein
MAAGVDFTAASLYGDGWTPAMAAALAGRADVVAALLAAAGSARAPALASARNRYGATALHVAARRGCLGSLRALLAAAPAAAGAADGAGDVPARVARRAGHEDAAALLERAAGVSGGAGASGRSRDFGRGRHSGERGGGALAAGRAV